jgi:hypothetical protein
VVVLTETQLSYKATRRQDVAATFAGGKAFFTYIPHTVPDGGRGPTAVQSPPPPRGASGARRAPHKRSTTRQVDPSGRARSRRTPAADADENAAAPASIPPDTSPHLRGVCVYVAPAWAPFASHGTLPPAARTLLDGSVQIVNIAHGHAAPLFARIVGVYMPAQSAQGGPPAALAAARRTAVLALLADECAACALARRSGTPYELFIAGDFNAALLPSDRAGGTRTDVDEAWAEFAEAHALLSLDRSLPREPTWGASPRGQFAWLNRIDDILCPAGSRAAAATAAVAVPDESIFPHCSDHRPLSFS